MVEADFVDKDALIEPRHENQAARRAVPSTGFDVSFDFTTAAFDPYQIAIFEAFGLGIFGVHVTERFGHCAEKLGNAHCHGT